ncbi:putative beta-glucosidase btgE [Spathaspora sp. JA1]|nr:putative beta-glucosidase btgE [Spathaspora sp. JA1]
MFNYILIFICLTQFISAIPIPQQPPVVVVTQYSTAPTRVVTKTYITGTTTVWLPPVGIIIDGDNTITTTLTESQWHTYPTTLTSIVERDQAGTPTAANPQPAPQPTHTTATPQAESTSTTTPAPAPPPTPDTLPAAPISSSITSAAPQPSSTTPAAPQPSSTTSAAPQPSSTTSAAPQPSSTTSAAPQPTSSSTTVPPPPPPPPSSSSIPPPASTITDNIPPPTGIVYSPYADNGGCKTPDQIVSQLTQIANKGIKNIRSYGTDCHAIDVMLPTAIQLGMSVNQGVWISQDGVDSIDSQVQQIIQYGSQNGWGVFQFITIGNEAINANFCTVDQLINKIAQVKTQLRNAGYGGQVSTAEPPIEFLQHPELCNGSEIDIVSVNPHSYFNQNIAPADAGPYIMQQKQQVIDVCTGKPVTITETGYPSQGNVNGVNDPTPENQVIAISSIISATGGDCTILTAFDDYWKQPGPYGIEQSFGVLQLFA